MNCHGLRFHEAETASERIPMYNPFWIWIVQNRRDLPPIPLPERKGELCSADERLDRMKRSRLMKKSGRNIVIGRRVALGK